MKYLLHNIVIIISLCMCTMALSCADAHSDKEDGLDDVPVRDLTEIQADGVLNVISLNNSTSYFLYRGMTMGYDYELVKHLSESLGVKVNIHLAENFGELIDMLERGEGDLIAAGMTINKERKERVKFTEQLYFTHQVLVQKNPERAAKLHNKENRKPLIRMPYELIGDTVYMVNGTSYYTRMQNLMEEIGGDIHLELLEGDISTEDIIGMVVDGEIDYTVADYNLAVVNKNFYPILDIDTELSLSQRIAWAVREDAPELLDAVNSWIRKSKEETSYNLLYNKYFKDKHSYQERMRSSYFNKHSGRISQYDDLIKKYSEEMEWDWRLVASLIFQESQFHPEIIGKFGSTGLMQLMPTTANSHEPGDLLKPDINIQLGTQYLGELYERFDMLEDSLQQRKFAMASYNSGYGHVLDAQRLAERLGLNPNLWDDNVEHAMVKLSMHKYYSLPEVKYGFARGRITYNYVREIYDRYADYKRLIPRDQEGSKETVQHAE